MKIVYILRGLSGSGKSTLAKTLTQNELIFEADKYMVDKNGNYKFDRNRLKEVHQKCYNDFVKACDEGKTPLVVSNTSTQEWEFMKYKNYAESKGYMVFSLIVENRNDTKNVHDVPEEVIETMRKRFEIKL